MRTHEQMQETRYLSADQGEAGTAPDEAPAAVTALVELKGIAKSYRIGDQEIHAVRDVDLRIERGQFVAIIGHSGSGKSTLLSMIGGLTRPTRGDVFIDGENIWAHDDDYRSMLRNQKIGFVFQFASLIPTLTAVGNVLLPTLLGPRNGRCPREEDAIALLERVGLGEKIDAFPNELSGGQQRRVAIARALLNRPRLLLADEPTGDLDEETEAEVMELMLETCRELDTAFLMVTHNRAIAETADRVLVMKAGRLS